MTMQEMVGAHNNFGVESHPGGGRRILIREIADRHFAENANQVYSYLLFVNILLQANGERFSLSPEILFPLLANREPVNHNNKFTLFTDFSLGDQPILKSRLGNTILTELQKSCDLVDIKSDNRKIFKMKAADRVTSPSSSQDENTPLVILEENSELDGENYLRLRFVKDPRKKALSDAILRDEDILTIDIRPHLWLTYDGSLNWLDAGCAEWVTDRNEPYVYLTDAALQVLSQPIDIHIGDIYPNPRSFFKDYLYYLKTEVFPNPDPDPKSVLFPIYFSGRAEERWVRPYYYLNLAHLGAKIIQLSILANRERGTQTISDELRNTFYEEMLEFDHPLFMVEFNEMIFDRKELSYSPIEYLMYELLWRGVNIWPFMDEFTDSMVQSFKTDPERFWDTVSLLGLDQVLPIFQGMDETSRKVLKDKLQPDSEPAILRRVFSLIPSLSPYYDKEKGPNQSDEYYMQITLALAAYSYDIGQDPVAAIAVNGGKIIGARRNDTKQPYLSDWRRTRIDQGRHAEILLINNPDAELPPNTKVFVSLLPCKQCAYLIRRTPNIVEVHCAEDSASGDLSSLTNPNLREDEKDEFITENPPLVTLGRLEDIAHGLHTKSSWLTMPRYSGTGVRIIDRRKR